MKPPVAALVACAAIGLAPALPAQDWPRWLGPADPVVADGGAIRRTFDGPLKPAWTVKLGGREGMRRDGGSPVVVGGLVYTFHMTDALEELEAWWLPLGDKQEWLKKRPKGLTEAAHDYLKTQADTPLRWDDRAAFDAWLAAAGLPEADRASIAGKATNQRKYRVNHLTAYHLATGERAWQQTWPGAINHGWGGEVHSTMAIKDGVIYLPEADGTVHARKLGDGSPIWQSKARVWGRYAGANSSPLVHGDLVHIQGREGHLALSKADGSLVWRTKPRAIPTEDSSPAIYRDASGRDVVLVPSVITRNNSLHGFDAATGEELWKVDHGGGRFVTPAIAKDRIITVQSAHGQAKGERKAGLYVYDTTQTPPKLVGSHVRDVKRGNSTSTCNAPVVRGDRCYWSTMEGVFCFSVADGSVLWKNADHICGNYSSCAVVGDVLITMVRGKGWAAFDAATGKLLHLQELADKGAQRKWHPFNTPALADGYLLFRDKPVGLVCYDLRSPGGG